MDQQAEYRVVFTEEAARQRDALPPGRADTFDESQIYLIDDPDLSGPRIP